MPLIGFTDRLDSIEENLLYKAQDGSYWLSGVCTFHQDAKGRTIVVQSVSKERYAAGEKGPQVGFWREIGSKDKPPAGGAKGFDLAKFKAAATQHKATGDGKYPPGQEGLCPSPQAAFDATLETQREPQSDTRHGSLEGNSDFERGSRLHALRAAKAARRGQMKPGGLGL